MNMNNETQNSNIDPNARLQKGRLALIVILSLLILAAISLLAINYFSAWQCSEGRWIRKGLPLSKKPLAGCVQKVQELKNGEEYQKKGDNSEAYLETPGASSGETYSLPEMGIEVTSPKKGEEIKSPLIVKGKVKTDWLFEGSFPIKILTNDKRVLAEGYAQGDGDWMDKDWVNFEGTIKFPAPNGVEGFLFLEPDDPTGFPKYGASVHFPVRFATDPEKFNSDSSHLFDKCGGYPPNERILGDCGEDCNTDNWKVYKNKKYGYSFRYPSDYAIVGSPKDCHSSCIWVTEGGDSVTLQGIAFDNIGPMLTIRHLQNIHYNPPPQTATGEWIKEKFPWTNDCLPNENIYFAGQDGNFFGGFDIFFPIKPQTYSRREIFYFWDEKIFQIEMLDLNTPQARQFYDIWLSTFQAAK